MGEIPRTKRRASIALGLLAAALIGPFIALLAACGGPGRGGEPAIHRSLVGVCRVDGDGLLQGEPGVSFVGDLFVRKESDARVVVEIGRHGWEFSSWVAEAPFGVLELESADGQWSPRIGLAALSEEHSKRLWR